MPVWIVQLLNASTLAADGNPRLGNVQRLADCECYLRMLPFFCVEDVLVVAGVCDGHEPCCQRIMRA